jgi:hypothetical protein
VISQREIEEAIRYADIVQARLSGIVCSAGPFTLDLGRSTDHLSVWHCQACGGTVHIGQSLIVDVHTWAHFKPKVEESK